VATGALDSAGHPVIAKANASAQDREYTFDA
jgi:hypothetical protein